MPLVRPFRVAGFTLTAAQTAVARVAWNDYVGYGEAAPLERYGDSVPAILKFFATYVPPDDAGPFSAARLLAGIPRAARCALDIALFDLRGKVLGASVTELLGLEGLERPPTSLTAPIEDDVTTVLARVRSLRDAPVLKVKSRRRGVRRRRVAGSDPLGVHRRDSYRCELRLERRADGDDPA